VIKFEVVETSAEKIKVGTSLIKQLSTTFYPNLRMVFDELVANARDAMATVVKIHIGEDKIIFEDNGEGMTKEQLVKFFYISHTGKEEGIIRTRGNIRRAIIGKFGIGKLTLYRLCNSFEIITWRKDSASKANFDFEEFEGNEFVDDFDLQVETLSDFFPETESGTKITLFGLKETLNAREVKRDLQRTMPLSPDFKVVISGVGIAGEVELRSEDMLSGTIYDVKGEDKDTGIGLVVGRIAFLESGRVGSGIYVRVLGRIVNYEDPDGIIDFKDITHAQMYERHILAELDANGLKDALLTNRSGFITDSKKYQDFVVWLKKVLKDLIGKEYEKFEKKSEQFEKETIPKATADFIQSSLATSSVAKEAFESYEKRAPREPRKKQREKPKAQQAKISGEDWISLHGLEMKTVSRRMGESFPEAEFDPKKMTITINQDHPMYIFARKRGKTWGALYHSVKAAAVAVSLKIAKDLKEFKELYDDMLLEAPQKLQDVKLKRNGNKTKKEK
jgi:hypothetical protein